MFPHPATEFECYQANAKVALYFCCNRGVQNLSCFPSAYLAQKINIFFIQSLEQLLNSCWLVLLSALGCNCTIFHVESTKTNMKHHFYSQLQLEAFAVATTTRTNFCEYLGKVMEPARHPTNGISGFQPRTAHQIIR